MTAAQIDTIRPRTIKAVSDQTWDKVSAAARRENLTVGQWLEKRVDEWEAAGSPVAMPNPEPTPAPSMDLAALLQAAGPFNADNPMPGQVRSLLNDIARAHRGPRQGNGVARIGNGERG